MDEKKAKMPENQQLNEMIVHLEQILLLIQKAQQTALRRDWFLGNAGETLTLPRVGAKTLYVDNSANANAVTIRLDGDLGVWPVAANSTKYVPCEGANTVAISGQGTCNILAINRDLFFAI